MQIYYLKNGGHIFLDRDNQYSDYMFNMIDTVGCNDNKTLIGFIQIILT